MREYEPPRKEGSDERAARDAERASRRRTVQARWIGTLSYSAAVQLQARLVRQRRAAEVPDQLVLLEHPHVITLGSSGDRSNVLVEASERLALGIELAESGRGGDVTYHGPGQLVGYPILDLKPDRKDVHRYLRDLEEVLIRVAHAYGVSGRRIPGETGVWTGSGKLAAIGVRVSSGWITSHGFALNVTTELSYFDRIIPCGLGDRRVTSLQRLLGREVEMSGVVKAIARAFGEVFGASISWAGEPVDSRASLQTGYE